MRHRSCQILFDHWREKRAGRLLPERGEIDPAGLRPALGDVFILAYNTLARHPFRLAGTRVCALAGRELKGQPFASLWDNDSHGPITGLIADAADDSIGLVAGATARNADGMTLDLELLLLPLRHCGQTHLRMIGALAPLATPYWLGARPISGLALNRHRFVGHLTVPDAPALTPPPPPSAPPQPPRFRRGLIVYDGGQA